MIVTCTSVSAEATQRLGHALGSLLQPGDVLLLTGELGAGKTQLTKGVARALGVARPITSPTFNLVYEYPGGFGASGAGSAPGVPEELGAPGAPGADAGVAPEAPGAPGAPDVDAGVAPEAPGVPGADAGVAPGNGRVVLRHFDLYRLDTEEQLDDIDYFGLLEDDVVSVVEWGDKFPQALPLDYLKVDLAFVDEDTRTVSFEAQGGRGQELLVGLEAVLPALDETLAAPDGALPELDETPDETPAAWEGEPDGR